MQALTLGAIPFGTRSHENGMARSSATRLENANLRAGQDELELVGDHLVDGRSALCDRADCGDEVVDVGDAFLEQVAEPLPVTLEELEGADDVDVGGEDAGARVAAT